MVGAGIATGYGLDGRGFGVRIPEEARFSPLHVIQTGFGVTQPPIQWVPWALPPG
jgi:hypothetical protein